jgi:hypothetical protein
MKAFHNDKKVKKKYLSRVQAHAKADEIIKGKYWEEGKGCAVGCTIHSSNHNAYETELGIPEWLAHVEDMIFEALPVKRAMKWPEEFLSSIPLGADLEQVKAPFLIFILESVLEKFDHKKFPYVKAAIYTVIGLYRSGETDFEKFRSAVEAAWAARAATWAPEAGAGAGAAAWAAEVAAEAAFGKVSGAAYPAMWAAAEAAFGKASWAAEVAEVEVEEKCEKFVGKLLDLIRKCK